MFFYNRNQRSSIALSVKIIILGQLLCFELLSSIDLDCLSLLSDASHALVQGMFCKIMNGRIIHKNIVTGHFYLIFVSTMNECNIKTV